MDLRNLFRQRREIPHVSLQEIRDSFNAAASDEDHFPSTIDPRIFHVRLIAQFLGDMNGQTIADIGCGKGRFARVLKDQNPGGHFIAFDLAEAMLRFVPKDLRTCCGSMTALPFRDAACDAAYATESLEHAVKIEEAVCELCRIVKPGGRIVIIDKNAEKWGKLKTPAWERWFRREELEAMLRRHCSHVSSEYISYWEDVPPDGLFLAWKAIRKG
ncbi:MAG: methyltransferase domain-containing protein [Bryobacteraceae bacterium]|nr:methyltransferase domain-containing protein [Bryobacteraceae bacterium]